MDKTSSVCVDLRPLDIATMRAAVRRLLAGDAELPTYEELTTLTLQLRGHIMLMIPEVEAVTRLLPENDLRRACARVSVHAARQRLDLEARPGLPAAVAHAQGLARAVGALCDHYENNLLLATTGTLPAPETGARR